MCSLKTAHLSTFDFAFSYCLFQVPRQECKTKYSFVDGVLLHFPHKYLLKSLKHQYLKNNVVFKLIFSLKGACCRTQELCDPKQGPIGLDVVKNYQHITNYDNTNTQSPNNCKKKKQFSIKKCLWQRATTSGGGFGFIFVFVLYFPNSVYTEGLQWG